MTNYKIYLDKTGLRAVNVPQEPVVGYSDMDNRFAFREYEHQLEEAFNNGILFKDTSNVFDLMRLEGCTGIMDRFYSVPKGFQVKINDDECYINCVCDEMNGGKCMHTYAELVPKIEYMKAPDEPIVHAIMITMGKHPLQKEILKSGLTSDDLSSTQSIEEAAKEYAERSCNGEYPITRSRENDVHYTTQDFIAGAKFQTNGMVPISLLEKAIDDALNHAHYSLLHPDIEKPMEHNEWKTKWIKENVT